MWPSIADRLTVFLRFGIAWKDGMLQLALPRRRQMMRAHRTLANHVAAFKTFARVILVNPRCSGRPGQSGRPSQSGRRVGVVDEIKISGAKAVNLVKPMVKFDVY